MEPGALASTIAILVGASLVMAGLVGLAINGGSWSYTPISVSTQQPPKPGCPSVKPGLNSLKGVLRSLGGRELNEGFWSLMPEYGADDRELSPYLEWLREALSEKPREAVGMAWYQPYEYYWFDNEEDWVGEPPPCRGPLRMGLLRLPFGATLVVTAYSFEGHLDMVIHATIVDGDAWRKLLARGAMFYTVESLGRTDITRRSEVLHGLAGSKAFLRTGWALWRIRLEGRGSFLEMNYSRTPLGNIYVLLEMPIYTVVYGAEGGEHYFYAAEALYWSVAGAPALGLALNLAYSEGVDPMLAYIEAVSIVRSIALINVSYPGNLYRNLYGTPFLLRHAGTGVCNEQSRASLMIAANSLGMATAYVSLYYKDINEAWLEHAVALQVHASSLMGKGLPAGVIKLPVDVDGDGLNDTASIIVDTAGLKPEEVEARMISLYIIPPLRYTYLSGGSEAEPASLIPLNDYIGAVEAMESLPAWLKPPWLDTLTGLPGLQDPLYIDIPRGEVDKGPGYGWIKKWWNMSTALADRFKVWGVPRASSPSMLYRELESQVPGQTPYLAPPSLWEKLFEKWVWKATGVEDVTPPSMILGLQSVVEEIKTIYSTPTPPLSG
jgi:hypothetical protein